MKIYLMTDMEGVAGVLDSHQHTAPDRPFYGRACELTTLETNAAIEGAIEVGATEFLVVDGHGWGAIDPALLHPAAQLLAGGPLRYPFGCDASFDAAFIIGQHAMANADGGHLCHTNSFNVETQTLNGFPIGELAANILMCSSFDVPTVFVSGDGACIDEARALISNIETAVVKTGLKRGSAQGLPCEENRRFNGAAVHLAPQRAREMIREGARRSLLRRHEIARFWLEPPYELETTFRADKEKPPQRGQSHANDVIEVFNLPMQLEALNQNTH